MHKQMGDRLMGIQDWIMPVGTKNQPDPTEKTMQNKSKEKKGIKIGNAGHRQASKSPVYLSPPCTGTSYAK